uniref:hypothetical protein n=1 Tax=Sodalis sp. (in: enterobacteria) TaxID=1898979 RepID=UPI003872D5D8
EGNMVWQKCSGIRRSYLEQEVNAFIQRHAEVKDALLMTSADWLMLMIRDYNEGQVVGRAWYVLPHHCIDDNR